MKIKKIIQYGSLFLGTLVFILTLHYLGFDSIIMSLKVKNPASFLIYLIISIIIFFGFVLRWYLILLSHGVKVPIYKLFNFRVAGFAISYLTPSARLGGEPIKTYFLTKEKVPLEKAMSSVMIDKSLELTANTIMTIIGAVILTYLAVVSTKVKWLLFLVVLSAGILLWLFYYRLFKGKGVFSSLIGFFKLNKFTFIEKNFQKIRHSELEMTNFFNNYKKVFIIGTIISFILWILTIFEFKYLLYTFGYDTGLIQIFLVLVAVGIAYLVPVPTALGVLEGVQVSLFTAFGKGASYGFAISLVTRVRDMMWTLYGLSYLYFKGVVVRNLLKDQQDIKVDKRITYFKEWKIK